MTDLSLARHIGAVLADGIADLDPAETAEWCEALDALIAAHGEARARFLFDALLAHARRRGVRWLPSMVTPYVNTIPLEAQTPVPGRPGDGAAPRRADALERAGDGDARQPRRERRLGRARRPHRQLRLGGRPVRGRLQPLLPRPQRRAGRNCRRPRLLPAALRARRLRPRLPRRAALRRGPRPLPPGADRAGARRARPDLVSASAADAGLLAVPDRLDGHRPDQRDLPGALHALPRPPRAAAGGGQHGAAAACLGLLRRRRDGRARIDRRALAGGAREARQLHLRHQLQPAAPRRPGARQRPDRRRARVAVRRRRLARREVPLVERLGRAVRARPRPRPDARLRRRPSTASSRRSRPRTAPSTARSSSARTRS